MEKKTITFDRFVRGCIVLGLVLALFFLIKRLSGVLLPFFIAWLLAYMMYPLVRFFEKKCRIRSRVLSTIISLLLIGGVGTAVFMIIIPPMTSELTHMRELLSRFITEDAGSNIPPEINHYLKKVVNPAELSDLLQQQDVREGIKKVAPKLWAFLGDSVNVVFNILSSFIILLYVFFILLDYENLNYGWHSLFSERYRGFASNLLNDVQSGMNQYFRGQALVAFCVGVLCAIGFYIIGFPLAIGFGLFVGLLNMVPYMQLLAFIPGALLSALKALDTGDNFWVVFGLMTLVICVVQLIQDTVLVPKIMGKITGLNAAIILLSLSVWGSLLGILGMIIALPMTTLLLSYYQRFVIQKEKIAKQKTVIKLDE